MLKSTSIRKNPKVVDKAAFPEQESRGLAIEVTYCDPVFSPLGLMAPLLLSGRLPYFPMYGTRPFSENLGSRDWVCLNSGCRFF